jgi:hypothetical protein
VARARERDVREPKVLAKLLRLVLLAVQSPSARIPCDKPARRRRQRKTESDGGGETPADDAPAAA